MRKPALNAWLTAACGLAVLLVLAAGCGGGGGGGGTTPPPPPPTLNITTTSLPNGVVNQAYNQTVQVTGGTGARMFSASAGIAPLSINATTGAITGTHPGPPNTTLSFTVTVTDSGTPQQTDSQALTIAFNAPLVIQAMALPNGNIGAVYPNQTLVTSSPGFGALTWSVGSGALPSGLTMNANGVISGTPDTSSAGRAMFAARVQDSSNPVQVDTENFTITVPPETGRNDTVQRATVLTGCNPCTRSASISPSGDPNTTLAPDQDFYQITATMGAIVTININAQVNGSPLDSVIEIVDANGVRLNVCSASTGPPYNQPCVNDDEGPTIDSILEMQVGATTTFFVHVNDFRGDARPDLLYQINISGAN